MWIFFTNQCHAKITNFLRSSQCYRAKARATGPVTASNAPATTGAAGGGGNAGRRTYTEDELQAALRDIQSGKLGTRRAAVLYGIPRSTLRNKVYKLAMERERDATLSNQTHSGQDQANSTDGACNKTTSINNISTTGKNSTVPVNVATTHNANQNATINSRHLRRDEVRFSIIFIFGHLRSIAHLSKFNPFWPSLSFCQRLLSFVLTNFSITFEI